MLQDFLAGFWIRRFYPENFDYLTDSPKRATLKVGAFSTTLLMIVFFN